MKISNWNNQPKIEGASLHTFPEIPMETVCVRGLGRSYGDASLDQVMLDMTGHKALFELKDGFLDVSSGFSVGEILERIVPEGYTLPVIPGTRHVTVGGMIAADVHGKNHVRNGSIGNWLEKITLRLSNNEQVDCSCEEHSALFHATIGGLGLTGIIVQARLKLEKISGTKWTQRNSRYSSLESLIDALLQSEATQKTAWFDARSKDRFFLLENDVQKDEETLRNFRLTNAIINVPRLPFPLISSPLMRVYNWNFARKLSRTAPRTVSWDECFFPLNRIANWNRLYGSRGFYQLQCVFPIEKASETYQYILQRMQQAGQIPVLSVMKLHGDQARNGILSYTHPGISVAFDLINAAGTADFIRELHGYIAREGGRIYLIKDALLELENFEIMYPEADEFRRTVAQYNSGRFSSLLAKRLNLVPQ